MAGIILLVATSAAVAAYWLQLIPQLLGGDPDVGRDFSVFYTAGRLATTGNWQTLYDMTAFSDAYDSITGLQSIVGGPVFRYPPSTAIALIPLSWLRHSAALGLWTALAPICLLVSLLLLRAKLSLFFPVMLSVPAVVSVYLGQNSFLMLAVLSAGAFFLRKDRPVAAGVLLGLLAFKPQLAIGVLLWLIVSRNDRRRELVAFTITIAVVGTISLIATPRGWETYAASLTTLATPPGVAGFGYFSGLDFIRFALGTANSQTVLIWWSAAAVGLAWLLVLVFRKLGPDTDTGLALAVLASLLLSPHLVAYDWILLVVPGALLWERIPTSRNWLLLWSGVLSFAALTSSEVVALTLGKFGRAISPAFLLLLLATGSAVSIATSKSQDPRKDSTSRRNLPV